MVEIKVNYFVNGKDNKLKKIDLMYLKISYLKMQFLLADGDNYNGGWLCPSGLHCRGHLVSLLSRK
jgi:hypothetical protein